MELNIVSFNSASLIPNALLTIAQVLIDILKPDIYCVSEPHPRTRNLPNITLSGMTLTLALAF